MKTTKLTAARLAALKQGERHRVHLAAAATNWCCVDGCSGVSYHPGGNCPDCNRALARIGRDVTS